MRPPKKVHIVCVANTIKTTATTTTTATNYHHEPPPEDIERELAAYDTSKNNLSTNRKTQNTAAANGCSSAYHARRRAAEVTIPADPLALLKSIDFYVLRNNLVRAKKKTGEKEEREARGNEDAGQLLLAALASDAVAAARLESRRRGLHVCSRSGFALDKSAPSRSSGDRVQVFRDHRLNVSCFSGGGRKPLAACTTTLIQPLTVGRPARNHGPRANAVCPVTGHRHQKRTSRWAPPQPTPPCKITPQQHTSKSRVTCISN